MVVMVSWFPVLLAIILSVVVAALAAAGSVIASAFRCKV